MTRIVRVALLAAAVSTAAPLVHADIKTDEKSQVKFGGMLGRMFGLFGGKGAREGIVSTVAVKGSRKATLNDTNGQIIDLDEEKVYELDMRRKTYEVVTFAELRRRMEEAQRKAEEQAAQVSEQQKPDKAEPQQPGKEAPQKEVEVDFDLKESGQKKNINGFDTREVIMTIVVREKGKTVEQGGGLVLTSNSWLASQVPSTREVAEFDKRYYEKLHEPMAMADAQTMAAALAMYPGLDKAMARMRSENVNLDGTAILTTMTVEAVRTAEQMAQSREEGGAAQPGIGGVLGGLRGRFGRKKEEKKEESTEATPAGAKNRTTIMTMQHEVLRIATDVAATDVALPAGFKQKS